MTDSSRTAGSIVYTRGTVVLFSSRVPVGALGKIEQGITGVSEYVRSTAQILVAT